MPAIAIAPPRSDGAIALVLVLSAFLLSAILVLWGIVSAGRLAWREAKGRAAASAVAARLWVVAVASLPWSGLPGLILLPGAAAGLSLFYIGRKGRRLSELPSAGAFVAVWRQFRIRYRAKRARFAWRLTQAQMPFFLLVMACAVENAAMAVFSAAGAASHVSAGLLLYFGVALLFLAALLLAASLVTYPWSQYQYAVVLQRFEGADEVPSVRRSAAVTCTLLLLDLILVATFLAPFALTYVADQRDWPALPLIVTWLSWPVALLLVTLVRMHLREILIIRGRGLGDGLSTTFRAIASDPLEALRGALLQTLCYVPLVLMALFVAPAVLVLVAVPGAAMAALHAAAWWLAGYHGNGHLWALLVEVPLLGLVHLMATGYLTSPLALFQMLYRAEYAKNLMRDASLITPSA